jgi:hypothetical protein
LASWRELFWAGNGNGSGDRLSTFDHRPSTAFALARTERPRREAPRSPGRRPDRGR